MTSPIPGPAPEGMPQPGPVPAAPPNGYAPQGAPTPYAPLVLCAHRRGLVGPRTQ